MASVQIHFKGESAKVIYPIPLPFDITGYTITVYVRKPDASLLTKTGTIVDAASGQISWVTDNSGANLSIVGEYISQVKAVSGSIIRYMEPETFKVDDTLA